MSKTSPPKYTGLPTTHAYSTKLDLPRGIVRIWCAGHTHYNFHHWEEGYELLSNQHGYANNPGFGYKKDLKIML